MSKLKTEQRIIKEYLLVIEILSEQMHEVDLTHSEKRGIAKVITRLAELSLVRIESIGYLTKDDNKRKYSDEYEPSPIVDTDDFPF